LPVRPRARRRERGCARHGFRFVCYCGDCQAFARFLGRPDVLDMAGGTDIFQMPTGRVKLTAGTHAVRCLHLSSKVFRWYTDCCRTPIGNTAGPRFPIVGVIHSFMDHDAGGRSRDEALGAPLCRILERSAVGPLPPNAPAPLRSASSPFAYQSFSAGGCAGSAGRTRSSTSIRTRRSPCRAYSRRVSAPPPGNAGHELGPEPKNSDRRRPMKAEQVLSQGATGTGPDIDRPSALP
jgi:hypothetical protein